jgi:uncharacterized membrane protein
MGVSGAVQGLVQGFANPENSKEKKEGYIAFVTFLLTFIITLLILSLFGQFLWNSSIVELFNCVRPAKSVWHILGLFVFSSLLLSV